MSNITKEATKKITNFSANPDNNISWENMLNNITSIG